MITMTRQQLEEQLAAIRRNRAVPFDERVAQKKALIGPLADHARQLGYGATRDILMTIGADIDGKSYTSKEVWWVPVGLNGHRVGREAFGSPDTAALVAYFADQK